MCYCILFSDFWYRVTFYVQHNPFKLEIINSKIPDGATVTAYRCGSLIDLCRGIFPRVFCGLTIPFELHSFITDFFNVRFVLVILLIGPHLPNTGLIKALCVTKVCWVSLVWGMLGDTIAILWDDCNSMIFDSK